jgi:methionyl aminopeptidase
MAIHLKSPREIAALREAGRLVAQTFEELDAAIRPGALLSDLDDLATEFIESHGAKPLYKGYQGNPPSHPPFPGTICASVNAEICHGIPDKRALRDGDIVGIDIGLRLDGFCGDACITFPVGRVSGESNGLNVVRVWGGHGIGRNLHEPPSVSHVGPAKQGPVMRTGMTFTIEPMINAGAADWVLLDDGWTVVTADGALSAQFEHTIAITDDGPVILSLP